MAASASATVLTRRRFGWSRLPVVHQLRQSVGMQRGMLVGGLVLTVVFILVAIFAPLLAPYSWAQLREGLRPFGSLVAPEPGHPWGTTVGGWLDRVLVVVCDAIYSFPSLLLAIVMAIAISGGQSSKWGGILAAAIAVTVVFIPQYFRVIRAETVRIKSEPFVEAAKVVGAPTRRIMFRHVLRNATRSLPLLITLNSSEAVLTLAGLGFIGFGIEPSAAAEWGYDLNKALSDVTSGIWWTALFPGLAIVLAVLGITLVGESLNDLADPRLRGRRAVESGAGDVAATSVVPGGSLDTAGLEQAGHDTSAGVEELR